MSPQIPRERLATQQRNEQRRDVKMYVIDVLDSSKIEIDWDQLPIPR